MNISIADYLSAHFNYFKDLIILLLEYRRAYRNYTSVLLHCLKRRYPFEAVSRSGETKLISSYREALYNVLLLDTQFTSSGYHIDLDFMKEVAIISPKLHSNGVTSNLKLYDSINNGDIFDIFRDGDYEILPVAGRTVIDIGANIGDTAVYFILRGATRVIAIEPYPRNYEIAMRNIKENNCSDKVTLLLAGCAGNSANITVDPMYRSSSASQLTEFEYGTQVPLLTLEQILNENDVKERAVLKMDCEGYEYDIILSASKETLQRFQHIQVEYHFGYKNLKEKLEECGFKVDVTRPRMPSLLKRYLKVFSKLSGRQEIQKTTAYAAKSSVDNKQKSIYESGCLGYLHATFGLS